MSIIKFNCNINMKVVHWEHTEFQPKANKIIFHKRKPLILQQTHKLFQQNNRLAIIF